MNSVAPMILVDDRERACGLLGLLTQALGARVAAARLESGDVQIGGGVVIERKEAADFVASLLDGRLARQAHGLAGLSKTVMIIIEGEFSAAALAGMALSEVRAAILSLQLDRGIPVIQSRDIHDTVAWIAALARRADGAGKFLAPTLRPIAQERPHPAGHRAPNPQSAIRNPQSSVPLAALRQVPGLGPSKARALLEHFGTMQKLLAAGEKEIAAAPGIGPALARAVRNTFHK